MSGYFFSQLLSAEAVVAAALSRPTQPRVLRGRGGSNRHRSSDLGYVRGVPGAKLAKKAAQGRLGLRHHGTPVHTR